MSQKAFVNVHTHTGRRAFVHSHRASTFVKDKALFVASNVSQESCRNLCLRYDGSLHPVNSDVLVPSTRATRACMDYLYSLSSSPKLERQ